MSQKIILSLIKQFKIQVLFFSHLTTLLGMVPLWRLHFLPLQMFLLSHWAPESHQWDDFILLEQSVNLGFCSLVDRKEEPSVRSQSKDLFTDHDPFTDAFMTGCMVGVSKWPDSFRNLKDTQQHTNILEMKADFLSLKALKQSLLNQIHVIILATDNSTVVYLQNQGAHCQTLYLRCHGRFWMVKIDLILPVIGP